MIQTRRPTWLLPPVDELTEFPVNDVARHLGQLVRYAGGVPSHYSVARHSLLVMQLLPPGNPTVRLLGLTHDVHECWIGDLLKPAKDRLKLAIEVLEKEYDERLRELMGFPRYIPPAYFTAIAEADATAAGLEMEWLGRQSGWEDFRHGYDAATTLATQGDPFRDAIEWSFAYWSLRRRAAE